MRKPEIAKRIARRTGVSQAEAADHLDRIVHEILARLRQGGEAPLGELGTFTSGPGGTVRFERGKGTPHE
jgi:nucleoid DNA-binding protein